MWTSTPSPNTSINWQWISRVEKFCLYNLSHHKVFCTRVSIIITPAKKTYPLNSMIDWLLHHLLHVTSITGSTSYHKMKGSLKKIMAVGTLLAEQASYMIVTGWQCRGIYLIHFPLACEDSNNQCRMFQANINDHKTRLGVVTILASAGISSAYGLQYKWG